MKFTHIAVQPSPLPAPKTSLFPETLYPLDTNSSFSEIGLERKMGHEEMKDVQGALETNVYSIYTYSCTENWIF